MNLFQLRAFDAVAKEGSFTRAAERLFISQPAVTGHVKALEAHYHVLLLRRGARTVSLTPEGKQLASITHALFGLADEAHAWLEARREVLSGQLAIAADSPQQVMPLLARLREHHPGVVVQLTLGNAQSTLDALLAEQVDVALITTAAPRHGLHLQPLAASRLLLLLPIGHPWAGCPAVRVAQLEGQGMVLREPGSMTRQTLETACQHAAAKPQVMLVVGSREAVGEAVAAGLGLGVVLSGELSPDPRLCTVPLLGEGLEQPHMLACLARRRELKLIRTVFELAG
ncbi:LysR substrate-binding domain-containing protein [Pseudomonas typographi]|uniref:LysR family transcriptional regulator n=1 Tax=Pseudomonas typographi TaxID=2715964 RepID=A0ABR7Z6H4_9PSED|nr:LysR substrate-binding domain-containing protein [Pseudomonas typographi]MBD1554315.1 LysR family transcriptional regulator [Pseudomonas typographi]MBD1589544.1 LysR family transcriptional regulator [Pseudomonas typographi]MBD1600924.1 LysR family transcriptional regulator [Pseudomonas typographi]